jgi:hypothetical protein
MDSIDDAIAEAATMSANSGMPVSTYASLLDGVRKRVGMIQKSKVKRRMILMEMLVLMMQPGLC